MSQLGQGVKQILFVAVAVIVVVAVLAVLGFALFWIGLIAIVAGIVLWLRSLFLPRGKKIVTPQPVRETASDSQIKEVEVIVTDSEEEKK